MRNGVKISSREILSLDIGAGENPKGSINTDIRLLPTIDVVCHALYLPFRSEVSDKVFLSHVIEHFRYRDSFNPLKECNRVLKLGGRIEIWTPNFQALGVFYVWLLGNINGKNPPMLATLLTGSQDYEENVHLRIYLERIGFHVVRIMGDSALRILAKILPSRCGNIGAIAVKVRS